MDLSFRKMKTIPKIITYFITASIALVVIACTPDPLPVKNIPTLTPHIVVSTQTVPDQSIVVLLTKSVGALDAGKNSDLQTLLAQIVVSDALVTVEHDGELDTLTYLGNGLYGNADTPILAGHNYKLNVNSPTVGVVTSTTQAQATINFETVSATLYENEYDTLAVINYSLKDPPGKNFYMVNVQQISATETLSSLLNPRLFTHVVSDEEFNEATFQEEFKVFFQHYSVNDTVAVSLTNISEDYYNYVQKRIDNRFSVISFATEPFNYPTNVQGGYGFFNMQQPDVRLFVLK
jgi:hypothetical protein